MFDAPICKRCECLVRIGQLEKALCMTGSPSLVSVKVLIPAVGLAARLLESDVVFLEDVGVRFLHRTTALLGTIL